MVRYNDHTRFVIVPAADALGNQIMLDASTSCCEVNVRKSLDLTQWFFSFKLPMPAIFEGYPQFNVDDAYTEMEKPAWKPEETQ